MKPTKKKTDYSNSEFWEQYGPVRAIVAECDKQERSIAEMEANIQGLEKELAMKRDILEQKRKRFHDCESSAKKISKIIQTTLEPRLKFREDLPEDAWLTIAKHFGRHRGVVEQVSTTFRRNVRKAEKLGIYKVDVLHISAGGNCTVVCVKQGGKQAKERVIVYGNNTNGQLGVQPFYHPWSSMTFPYPVNSVAASSSHIVLSTTKGELFAWGSNDLNQLGLGLDMLDWTGRVTVPKPTLVTALNGTKVTNVATGPYHTAVCTHGGELFTFGACGGKCGARLGLGQEITRYRATSPMVVTFPPQHDKKPFIIQVATGENHSAAVSTDGRLYTFGSNDKDQLGGIDLPDAVYEPKLVETGNSEEPMFFTAVSAGLEYTAALTGDGRLYTFGANDQGQLGLSGRYREQRAMPTRVQGPLHDENIVQVSCGNDHIVVCTKDGKVFTWGSNRNGQVRGGEYPTSNTRVQYPQFFKNDILAPYKLSAFEEKKITQVVAGATHTVIAADDGSVTLFGQGGMYEGCPYVANQPLDVEPTTTEYI